MIQPDTSAPGVCSTKQDAGGERRFGFTPIAGALHGIELGAGGCYQRPLRTSAASFFLLLGAAELRVRPPRVHFVCIRELELRRVVLRPSPTPTHKHHGENEYHRSSGGAARGEQTIHSHSRSIMHALPGW